MAVTVRKTRKRSAHLWIYFLVLSCITLVPLGWYLLEPWWPWKHSLLAAVLGATAALVARVATRIVGSSNMRAE
jgi:hypothetical protein